MITYALLALCAAVFFGTFWLDGAQGRARFPRLRQLSLVLQIGAVFGAYAAMRPGRGVDGQRAILDSQTTGRPVLLDVYSNFWGACLLAKPVVDGLEKKLDKRLTVARIDIGDDTGSSIAQRYGVSAVPAFIVLDGGGNVIYRKIGGKPDVTAIEAALARIGK